MVLDAPDRLEAERLGQVGQRDVGLPDVVVRERSTEALEDG